MTAISCAILASRSFTSVCKWATSPVSSLTRCCSSSVNCLARCRERAAASRFFCAQGSSQHRFLSTLNNLRPVPASFAALFYRQ